MYICSCEYDEYHNRLDGWMASLRGSGEKGKEKQASRRREGIQFLPESSFN